MLQRIRCRPSLAADREKQARPAIRRPGGLGRPARLPRDRERAACAVLELADRAIAVQLEPIREAEHNDVEPIGSLEVLLGQDLDRALLHRAFHGLAHLEPEEDVRRRLERVLDR
jgi:hypothetical protein